MNEKTYTVNQLLSEFKIGRTKAYEEITTGRLATYNVGRRRFISAHAAVEWQRKLEEQANIEALKTFGVA